MAIAKSFLRKTHQEVLARVGGGTGSVTISLANDLLPASGQVAGDVGTQNVSIIGVGWTGLSGSSITVARGGVNVFTLDGASAAYMDFDGQEVPAETTNATSDIVVTVAGAEAQVWLKLRKVEGYVNYVENATYGAYDDPTRLGASTTLSGSPDKV